MAQSPHSNCYSENSGVGAALSAGAFVVFEGSDPSAWDAKIKLFHGISCCNS